MHNDVVAHTGRYQHQTHSRRLAGGPLVLIIIFVLKTHKKGEGEVGATVGAVKDVCSQEACPSHLLSQCC